MIMMIRGVVIFAVGLFAVLYFINWMYSQPTLKDEKFKVVDTYKGCDVIQYSPTNAARYEYFLYCGDS
jgi:hypothetical protein